MSERRTAEAALSLVDSDGVEGLSMRKLAERLNVPTMSLYTYIPDRDAVLEALTQLVLAEITSPAEDLDWRETIRQIMRSIRVVGLPHPQAAPLLGRFPPRTVDALAFVEAGFRAFHRAGFDDVSTARCYPALTANSLGSLEVELGGYFTDYPAGRATNRSLDAPTLVKHLSHVVAVGPALSGQDDAGRVSRTVRQRLVPGRTPQSGTAGCRTRRMSVIIVRPSTNATEGCSRSAPRLRGCLCPQRPFRPPSARWGLRRPGWQAAASSATVPSSGG